MYKKFLLLLVFVTVVAVLFSYGFVAIDTDILSTATDAVAKL
ncbi:hypothetical protein SELR_pSRC500060 (plasmid) [Selenomonas ruminantium subsp. lactilytica TAM6421]|uniref:Uncharacterized protein n=1 Tax=Selenomonas ruminantium subsp. lactilytica (strain NBRC 103574 / TAM6421) TaxID=927704 RepID=I0GWP3_SELRL|nr:hypothetical protein [Selenomonas ruminantium]BAL85180.1 hypothetical protein SELR_pSRC500060 [Selenomonas ruminantium subsp. lactilytica TAM6421]